MNRNEWVSVARPHKAATRSLHAARLLSALIGLLVNLPAAQGEVVLELLIREVGVSTDFGSPRIRAEEVNPLFTSEFTESVAASIARAEQMTVIDIISESGIIAGASGNGSVRRTMGTPERGDRRLESNDDFQRHRTAGRRVPPSAIHRDQSRGRGWRINV